MLAFVPDGIKLSLADRC